jgi:hypothetical protein
MLAVLVSGELLPRLPAMLTLAVPLAALAPAPLLTLDPLPRFPELPASAPEDSRLTPVDPLPALPALLSVDALPGLLAPPPTLLEFEEPAGAGPAALARAGAE